MSASKEHSWEELTKGITREMVEELFSGAVAMLTTL